jgi:hypothetical protein
VAWPSASHADWSSTTKYPTCGTGSPVVYDEEEVTYAAVCPFPHHSPFMVNSANSDDNYGITLLDLFAWNRIIFDS